MELGEGNAGGGLPNLTFPVRRQGVCYIGIRRGLRP
jgi:hypothetical protein